jgi:hypothetical protein
MQTVKPVGGATSNTPGHARANVAEIGFGEGVGEGVQGVSVGGS